MRLSVSQQRFGDGLLSSRLLIYLWFAPIVSASIEDKDDTSMTLQSVSSVLEEVEDLQQV